MANILILGAGSMGTAFSFPCSDKNHFVTIIGTHLENDFIDLINSKKIHPALECDVTKNVKFLKFEKLTEEINAQPDYAIFSLHWAIKLLFELDSRVNTSYELVTPQISTTEVIDIFSNLIDQACEGQSLVIAFGAIMKTRLSDLEITCHPPNQAGSSSNEIGDVDFSKENKGCNRQTNITSGIDFAHFKENSNNLLISDSIPSGITKQDICFLYVSDFFLCTSEISERDSKKRTDPKTLTGIFFKSSASSS